jgi:hypothetical protein
MPLTPNEDGSYRYEFPTDSDENLAEVIEAFERLKEADSAYYRNIRAQAEEPFPARRRPSGTDGQRFLPPRAAPHPPASEPGGLALSHSHTGTERRARKTESAFALQALRDHGRSGSCVIQ